MGGGLERISESLQLAESKKDDLGKSILSLMVQWNDFEGQLDLAQEGFSEGLRELDSKEKKLDSEKESLELRRESVEQRFRVVGDREHDFALFRAKKIRDLELQVDEFVRTKESYAEKVCEQLDESEKRVEQLCATLKSEKLQMEGLENFVEKRFKELGLQEEALEKKRKEFEMIQNSIEKKTREHEHNEEKIKERERKAELKEERLDLWEEHQIEIKSKERQLQLMIEDLEFQEKRCDFIRQLNEKQMEELELKERELKDLESKKKGFVEEIEEFEFRKKELEESVMELHSKNKDFLSQKKLLEEESERLQQRKAEFGQRTMLSELAQKELEKSLKEFDLKEEECLLRTQVLEKESKDLESKWREYEQRIKECNVIEKALEKSIQEFHVKEKHFELEKKLFEKESSHLELRRKELEESVKKFELREKELELNEKKIEGEKKLLQEDSKHLESGRKELEERIEKFELTEKELESYEKKIEGEKKLLQGDCKHLDSGRKELEERIEKLELRERELGLNEKKIEGEKKLLQEDSKHLESGRKELEERIEKLELREKELELNEKKIEGEKNLLQEDSKHLESGRKELEERIWILELREKELELKEKRLESGKKFLEIDSQHLESRRKGLEESIQRVELREKEVDLKEKQLGSLIHARLKGEIVHDAVSQSLSCNDVDLRFLVVMMGGKDLQIFLNEREKDHHLMAEEVFKALHLSKDPAKLVLDAMVGFFPPHLGKHNGEFSGNVVRRSCMLLLQQLIRILPTIQPCVREEALKLAREWKTKLTHGSPLEVSSFLYLLGAYGLASAFDSKDIMLWLESISRHQQKLEPELCARLGVKEKIPSVIENLLKSHQSMEAIKFIYGFELVDCFPPVPILKNYLKHVKRNAIKMLRVRGNKENVQNESIDVRVAAMESVIRCIVDHKLESEYSPKGLQISIRQLLMQKNGKKFRGSSNCHRAQGKKKFQVKQISSIAAPSQPKAHNLAPDSSKTLRGPSCPMAAIIANMAGKNLLFFISSHVVEHELLQNEVSSALQISDNSPKLVLDAVGNLYDSHLTEEETKAKSCIFLLQQLMRLSPHIMPGVKEAAKNIAFDWKAKLTAKNGNSLLTLAYLLLISAYKLDLTFHGDELLNLNRTVAEKKPLPGLSHALGISEDVSKAAALHSQVETQKGTSKSLSVNNTVSTSMVPELRGGSQCTNMDLGGKECVSVCSKVPTFIKLSSNPAGLILDALRNCHQSNFPKNKNRLLVVKSFSHLLEQFMATTVEIKPDVKGQAYEFALDWKSKSIGPHQWEALGFLQLVASYQLSSFFNSDQLFCLLEVVYPAKKAGNLIRNLSLVDKVSGFISKLITKKKLLLAFAHVYEFELADMFPPVALLKQHVLYSKVIAKKIFHEGRKTKDAQDKSIDSEISALKAVIKLINRNHLESEYSPDELRSKIKELQSRRANLKASMKKVDAKKVSHALEVPMQQVNNKRRTTSDSTSISEVHLQPANKFPRLVSPSQFSNRHPIQCEPPSSQHPHSGNCHEEPLPSSFRSSSRQYSLDGSPLVCPPQNL